MSKRSLVAVAGLLLLAACADPSTSPSDLVDGNTTQRQGPSDPCRLPGDPQVPQAALRTTSALRATEQAIAVNVRAFAQVPSCPVQ